MLSTRGLTPDTVVDITHESVIRKWKQLKNVGARGKSQRRVVRRSRARRRALPQPGRVSLWQDPELAGVQQRRRDEGWNEAWAEQYRRPDDPLFSEVLSFLEKAIVSRRSAGG